MVMIYWITTFESFKRFAKLICDTFRVCNVCGIVDDSSSKVPENDVDDRMAKRFILLFHQSLKASLNIPGDFVTGPVLQFDIFQAIN